MAAAAPDLAPTLAVLASPIRLRLLSLLRQPRTLRELEVTPARREGGASPARPMSVASLRTHLARLVELGLVASRPEVRSGRVVTCYEVNRSELMAVTEAFLALAKLPGPDESAATMPGEAAAPPSGPSLTVVRGLEEGRRFPLDGEPGLIGRAEGVKVRLPYDGFVSQRNSRITARDGAHFVEDVAGSRNGTWVNWVALRKGEKRSLESGDVVGVGRTLLLFRS